ncbi:hypothetical protein ACPVPU_15060 [Sphingomonas sp. CJ99]
MTKPQSIVQFDRFYLASIVVWLVGVVTGYGASMQMMADNPAFAANPQMLEMMPAITIGTAVLGLAISVLLWWLVSKKASAVGKWIIVVLFALQALAFPFSLMSWGVAGTLNSILGVVVFVLHLAAVVMLFRADSSAWFNRGEAGEPVDRTFG